MVIIISKFIATTVISYYLRYVFNHMSTIFEDHHPIGRNHNSAKSSNAWRELQAGKGAPSPLRGEVVVQMPCLGMTELSVLPVSFTGSQNMKQFCKAVHVTHKWDIKPTFYMKIIWDRERKQKTLGHNSIIAP